MTEYDKDNVFAKIIRGEIPTEFIVNNDVAVAFNDISPEAPIHALVIPKGEYVSFNDFVQKAGPENVAKFFQTVQEVAEKLGVDKDGYRLITNHGTNATQTVFHFHVHVLGGGCLGASLLPAELAC